MHCVIILLLLLYIIIILFVCVSNCDIVTSNVTVPDLPFSVGLGSVLGKSEVSVFYVRTSLRCTIAPGFIVTVYSGDC